jgi:hypothetical protein
MGIENSRIFIFCLQMLQKNAEIHNVYDFRFFSFIAELVFNMSDEIQKGADMYNY